MALYRDATFSKAVRDDLEKAGGYMTALRRSNEETFGPLADAIADVVARWDGNDATEMEIGDEA